MNVTLNTNTQYKNQYKYQFKQPAFKANPAQSAREAMKEVAKDVGSESSEFFKFFTDRYAKATDWLSENFARHVFDNKYFGNFAESLKDTNKLFQHCLTVGSAITSGLYMQRTLTNEDMDKDRKKTLAVNQGLTFIVSTIGAYSLDKYLGNWWENVSAKYVQHQTNDENFAKDFKDVKTSINRINKGLKDNKDADLFELAKNVRKDLNMNKGAVDLLDESLKEAVKQSDSGKVKSISSMKLDGFIEKLVDGGRLEPLAEKTAKKIKGIGLLKSMLVFGFVYRYFVPVAVTKPANILCEKYLEQKKAKDVQKV